MHYIQEAETKEGLLVLNSLLHSYTAQDLLLTLAPPILWMGLPVLIKAIQMILYWPISQEIIDSLSFTMLSTTMRSWDESKQCQNQNKVPQCSRHAAAAWEVQASEGPRRKGQAFLVHLQHPCAFHPLPCISIPGSLVPAILKLEASIMTAHGLTGRPCGEL